MNHTTNPRWEHLPDGARLIHGEEIIARIYHNPADNSWDYPHFRVRSFTSLEAAQAAAEHDYRDWTP